MLSHFKSHLARAGCCIRVMTSSSALSATAPLHLFRPLHFRRSVPTLPTKIQPTVRVTMYKPTYLPLVAALVAVTLVAPSPIEGPTLQRRQGVNCSDPNAITSGTCWEELHLAEYLTNWDEKRPICTIIDGTLEDGANCCAPNEAWSTCFIRLAIGNHGYNCLNINEGTCPNFEVGASTAPEQRYILGTMYSKSSLESHILKGFTKSVHQVSTISSATGTEHYLTQPFRAYSSTSPSYLRSIPSKRPISFSATSSPP